MKIVENFKQLYKELIDKSPHLAVHNFRCENSDYSDQLNDSQNAYICFNGYGLQDCYYNYDSRWNKDSSDLSFSNKCELCYSCIDCDECYNCNFCQDCERCTDLEYCYDCVSSENCFGCFGLRRAKYQIFNVQYSKEDYAAKLKEIKSYSKEIIEIEVKRILNELSLKSPRIAVKKRNALDSLGNYLFDAKSCKQCFKVHDMEDCAYAYESRALKDSVDVSMNHKSQLMYEAIEATDNYNCNFLFWCANCKDSEYVMYCFNVSDCFGCFNLKHKRYHILNQPYEKDEYFETVDLIKEHLRVSGDYTNFLPDLVRN